MSRKQQKRHMRQEMWDTTAEEFKAKRRLKSKESRKRRRQERAQEEPKEQEEKRTQKQQEHSGCRVVLDMDFDNRMGDHEIRSVCSQVGRCYAVNRQAQTPVDLHITKLHGRGKSYFETKLEGHRNWNNEYIRMEESEYVDLFPKDQLVYLTADSPNVIETLDPAKAYIIGGIVDKNRYPRLTLDKAEAQGIAHAQLPIGKYVRMATRKIMTVNQIFEMLLKFLELRDWERAFLEIIPQRKFKEAESTTEAN
ncbi:tRNA (guanine(9)-N(1))-methyltransferase [Coemansia sp. RSA 1933]|nr:tRNA (guanine(9)-N(1))-methyltransferase [Coemansia sp. RSA 1933]